MAPDELLETFLDPTSVAPNIEPIWNKTFVTLQFCNAFRVDIHRRLNKCAALQLGNSENNISCRQVTRDKTAIPHTPERRVLEINHYARLAGHPDVTKLYSSIRKDMYVSALPVGC